MRFLIVSKPKFMVPPELGLSLIDAFTAFIDKNKAAGKLEAAWSFTNTQGGGGIINVDSLEELDSLLAEYPYGPFNENEIYPLVDLKESMQRVKQVVQMRAQQMGG
jgi:muconolactone delta-isomerase